MPADKACKLLTTIRTIAAGKEAFLFPAGPESLWNLRVYIAKITFTTLIDHFTSLLAIGNGL